MRLQSSFILLAALSASMTMARLHGHDRRHQHQQRNPQVEERGMVTATIGGKTEVWDNNYYGASTTPPTSPAETTSAPSTYSTPSTTSTPSTSNTTGTANGFGGRTNPSGSGIDYVGNVGIPYGSNIIQIAESDVSSYKYVAKLYGFAEESTVAVWLKIGRDGKLTGWYGGAVITFSVQPGETKYLAFDEDTQGALCGAPGDKIPTDQWGGYACTWLEFDFGDCGNKGWSGFDVSIIQAQAAGLPIQPMKACQAGSSTCSSVGSGGSQVSNAYVKSNAAAGGIGGNIPPGPLTIDTCFS